MLNPTFSCAYRHVGQQPVLIDVYCPSRDRSTVVLVYFHSGGLTAGSRLQNEWFPTWLLESALQQHATVVIPDYSLLSPGTGWDMLRDVQELALWLTKDLHQILALSGLPPITSKGYGVLGQSAGGYLAYLMATEANPKPTSIGTMYAMGGNFLSDHYVIPKKGKFQKWMNYHMDDAKFTSLVDRSESDGIVFSTSVEDTPRVEYFSWLLQKATFLDRLTGCEGLSADMSALDEIRRPEALPPGSTRLFPELNIDDSFPPTYLIHGSADSAVLVGESDQVKKSLNNCKVINEYHRLEGLEHGFDWAGECPEDVRPVLHGMVHFVIYHVASVT